ncbi:hypothetical protein GPK34_08915 [Secundilactobacillus kimchicus]|uniref:HTH tetR-type domain-containing protein n=1 Tax=Secundilactobacillus kimchicus JCM 15530 TaxID=1302272 RepID=A0A0R1HXK9_9LACO|nr:TetR/AcrR family transcriptional regulator [Secundilactobacillus kimchicus]KRK48628.1 hypothetical protein FC96_GL000941 [Secundilactobacillus kimchicus JCM 15530]MBT9672150.1 hypothetical protein [Secundilactobacillus kimchicus]
MLETRETEKKLFDAFVSMVLTEQLPIKKVTVTRITAKAGVNRRTFYTHFEDVYDLHRQLQNWLVAEFDTRVDHLVERGVFAAKPMISDILDCLVVNRDYALAIAQLDPEYLPTHVANFIGKAILASSKLLTFADQKGISDSEIKYQAYFLSDATSWISYRWLKNDMDMSKDMLVEMIYRHVLVSVSQVLDTNVTDLID